MTAAELEEGQTISACFTQPDLIGWTLVSCEEVERLEEGEPGPMITEYHYRSYFLLLLERPTGSTRTAWIRGEDDVTVVQ